jgi:hypothetical protein
VWKLFKYAWGCSFEINDHVMVGIYYQKWGCVKNYYVHFANSQMVYLGVDLVVAWVQVWLGGPTKNTLGWFQRNGHEFFLK